VRVALLDHSRVGFSGVVLGQAAHLGDEASRASTAQLVRPGKADQLVDVRRGLLAVQSPGDGGGEIGFGQRGLEQGGRPQPVAFALQAADQRDQPLQRSRIVVGEGRPSRRIAGAAKPQMAAVLLREQHQPVVGDGTERRTQDREERQRVVRIGRQGEQLHQVHHLPRTVETPTLEDEMRDAPAQERAAEHVDVGEAAQEDGDVSSAHRPRLVAVEYPLRRSRRQQARDAPAQRFRFRLDAGAGDGQQLRAGPRRARGTVRSKRVLVPEWRVERAFAGRQRDAEEPVAQIDQRWPGSARFAKHVAFGAVAQRLRGEGLRGGHVGPAEFVDGLLAIADQHQCAVRNRPGSLPARARRRGAVAVLDQPAEQLELCAAGVLELVHQQDAEPGLLLPAHGQVRGQQVPGQARQIVEIEP